MRGHERLRSLAKGQRLPLIIAMEEAIVCCAWIVDHDPGRIRGARERGPIDFLRLQQLLDQRPGKKPIGARRYPDPFIRDGGLAGFDWVNRDELSALAAL